MVVTLEDAATPTLASSSFDQPQERACGWRRDGSLPHPAGQASFTFDIQRR